MNLKSFRCHIQIDDPETGEVKTVAIRVKRMTVPEGTKFARDYYLSANPPSNSMVCRKPDGEEQEKKTIGEGTRQREVYVISDDEIKQRRLAEMTGEQRERYRQMDEAEEAFANEFIADTLAHYVRVEPNQGLTVTDDFENPDAEPREIRAGLELANAYGARQDVIQAMLRAVHLENALSAQAKKVLRPLFGFAPSSGERDLDLPGQKPEPTAGSVENSVSANNEDARPEAAPTPSGLEAPTLSGIGAQ